MTNSKSLLVTLRSLLKKMPPKKGLKNLSMMASENPSSYTRTTSWKKPCSGIHVLDNPAYVQPGGGRSAWQPSVAKSVMGKDCEQSERLTLNRTRVVVSSLAKSCWKEERRVLVLKTPTLTLSMGDPIGFGKD